MFRKFFFISIMIICVSIIGGYNIVFAKDLFIQKGTTQTATQGEITGLEVIDINNDGIKDIIVGTWDGYVYIFNWTDKGFKTVWQSQQLLLPSKAFKNEWNSININFYIAEFTKNKMKEKQFVISEYYNTKQYQYILDWKGEKPRLTKIIYGDSLYLDGSEKPIHKIERRSSTYIPLETIKNFLSEVFYKWEGYYFTKRIISIDINNRPELWFIRQDYYRVSGGGFIERYYWDGKELHKKNVSIGTDDTTVVSDFDIAELDNYGKVLITGIAKGDFVRPKGADESVFQVSEGGIQFFQIEDEKYNLIWQSEDLGGVKHLVVDDVDNDGKKEIVVGDWQGYIHIFHSKP